MSQRRPRVAVLYDHSQPGAGRCQRSIAHSLTKVLKALGLKAFPMGISPPLRRVVRRLENQKPDVVFNLVDGFDNDLAGGARIAGVLELLGVPFTGSPSDSRAIWQDRTRARALLIGLGLPTAPATVLDLQDPFSTPVLDPWRGPVVIKAASRSFGKRGGIDQENIVNNAADLPDCLEKLRSIGGSKVLLESYLPGLEYRVGVLALPKPVALPIAEVLPAPDPDDPIIDSRPIPIRCPSEVESPLADRLEQLAVSAFLATGCRDLAQVDFRLDERGEPRILAVDPSPDLRSDAIWSLALQAAGLVDREVFQSLVFQALERGCGSPTQETK